MKNHISKNTLDLRFLGGAGFVVETEDTIVAIDPYLGGDAKPGFERITPSPVSEKDLSNIDFLVSTHTHLDHCDPALINFLAQESTCRFLGPESSVEKMIEAGAPEKRITTLPEGAELGIGSLYLKTVHLYDPYEPHALGIILESDTLSLLHGGDSHYSDDYKTIASDFSIDIALLSCGLDLYMTIDEMLTAAKDLQCQVFIPMHWDLWQALYIPIENIQEKWQQRFNQEFDLISMQAGQHIKITKYGKSIRYEFQK